LKRRERYGNASEWIDDLRPAIQGDPQIREKSRHRLSDRLFIGGLKNVLAGVTTVAHHNPIYREFGLHFPVRLVDRYGWAHSLALEHGPVGAHGEPGGVVAERFRSTPCSVPFIVHAAEGVDDRAASEVDVLDAAGALAGNTVLVHGLAIDPPGWHQLFERGVALVWCPASNQFLFGRTLCMGRVLDTRAARGRVCIGSDSRVTGSRDLLDELRIAATAHPASDDLLRMVSTWAADTLRLSDRGRLRVGLSADLAVIPAVTDSASASLLRCRRSEVDLVVRRGVPVVGAPALLAAFTARRVHAGTIEVDDAPRLVEASIAKRIARCSIQEPGVRSLD
jgi:hypothetical protein